MERFFLSLALTIAMIGGARAQYVDYGLEAQRIMMESNMMMNNYLLQMMQMMQKQEENASAFSMFVPINEQENTFSAFIMTDAMSANTLLIKCYNDEDNSVEIPLNKCMVARGYVITPPIFKPGYKISIRHKSTLEQLFKETIPTRTSEDYSDFLKKVAKNVIAVNVALNMNNNGSFYNNSSSSSSNTNKVVCSYCNGSGEISNKTVHSYVAGVRRWNESTKSWDLPVEEHKVCPSCSGKGYIEKSR